MNPLRRTEAVLGRLAGRLRSLAGRPRPDPPRRLLVIACHWVGDSLWATQVWAPLAERYGADALWVAAPARTTALWRAHAPPARILTVEHVVSDRRRERFSPSSLLQEIADVRRLEFDAVLDVTGNRYSTLLAASLGAWCCGPATHPWAHLYDVATPSPPRHLAYRPFDAARPLLGDPPADLQPIPPPLKPGLADALHQRLSLGERPLAVLVPGAGWATKRWPAERFRALAERLAPDHAVVALGALAEQPILEQAVGPHGVANSDLGLLESTALCGAAAVVVSNDNGLAHLAASTGARVVALFGPTNPARYRPLGPQVTVLRHGCPHRPEGTQEHCHDEAAYACPASCWDELTVERVWAAVSP